MTAYSTACYFARQAADLCRYNGLYVKGFSRLPSPLHGAIWQFAHEDSGLVILLNSSGAVNAKATKAAKAAAADLAAQEAAAADLAAQEAAAAPDCLCLLCGQEFTSYGGLVQVCPACFPEGRAESHAVAFVETEGESVPFFDLPELRPAPARRWPALPAFSFPLAPVARNLESPLMAFAATFADRAARAALGRGAF